MDREELARYDKECWNGTVDLDDEKFGAAEYRYFHRLMRVYDMYRRQAVTRDQAQRLKGEAYNDYRGDVIMQEMYREGVKRYQQMVKDSERLLNAYHVTGNVEYLKRAEEAFGLQPV